MVQREDNNHIESRGLSWYDGPEDFERFRLLLAVGYLEKSGIVTAPNYVALVDRIDALQRLSRRSNDQSWGKYDAEKAKASGYKTDAIV